MKYKIFLLLAVLFLASCNSSKKTVYHRKPASRSVAVKKTPARKTPTRNTTKPSSNGSSGQSETLEAVTRVKVTTELVNEYIARFEPIARGNMSQYGIPASIILAQGILESGSGTGPLSVQANNHFGIKCHDWTGDSVRHDDDSAQECFRKYNDPSESYRDHALFLTGRKRYAGLFDLGKDDYRAWAKGLRAAGYATDPKYPEKLIGLIERYNLDRFDALVLGREYNEVPKSNPSSAVAVNTSEGLYEVVAGDTLYSISRKFSLTVDQLKNMNNLTDNALSIGQNLKVK